MIYQITSYLSFLLRSTNQHGVHSPFVYDLLIKCFYNSTKYTEYKTLATHRQRLKNDGATITVTDFGAGSRVFDSNQRKVSDIAKHAGISPKRQRLLFRLSRYFQPKNALELGTSLGMGTAAMAMGAPKAKIISIEGCSATSEKAKEYLGAFQFDDLHIANSSFTDFFQQAGTTTFDMVYIDGNHSKKATLFNFKALLGHVHADSVLIFDDIYWSKEMTEAWQEIVRHPKVTVSIDTFHWGLVFFRREQRKEHFVIRV
ncbi:MAG: class I SAM-dependent methyltransferase [Marinirhabdus sp.]|nr:class I SAM-dependent methyltransferase [Marinirhabdus sp.]